MSVQIDKSRAKLPAACVSRRSVLSLLGSCVLLHGTAGNTAQAHADLAWTRLIVPSTPGSVSYRVAHALAAAWPAFAGHPLVVIERAGSTGALALQEVARGPADGSMLLLGNTGTQVVRPEVMRSRGTTGLSPLAKLASAPGVLVGHFGIPASTLAGLVQLARTRPGQLSFASAGVGSLGHLVMASICMHTGMALWHVPYKSSAESISDLLAGRVDLHILSVGAALPLLGRGRLKAFAFSGTDRSTQLAEIPTFRESGFEGADIESWQGLFVNRDIPAAAQRRLEAVVAGIQNDGLFRRTLHAERLDVAATAGPSAFSRLIEAQRRQVRTLMDRQGLRLG